MNRFSLPLLCTCLVANLTLAQSPGPTDPAGPQLQPPTPPRSGTELNEPKMTEEIERGTPIDRREVLDEPEVPDEPASDTPPAQPNRPLQPR